MNEMDSTKWNDNDFVEKCNKIQSQKLKGRCCSTIM